MGLLNILLCSIIKQDDFMGFLSNLIGKHSVEKDLVETRNVPITKEANLISVHEDIRDLIWVSDGPNKNYVSEKKEDMFQLGSIQIIISSMISEEPSSISLKLPVKSLENSSKIERPSYCPRYVDITPEQRGEYWKLLADPYNPNIDIGYVFILYYGLERHLLNGDYEKAFDIILKLRDVHKNGSFQSYSANALILTCICRKRTDLIIKFIQSIDHNYELDFSDNLYLLCKFELGIPISAKDMMRMAKTFEFTNLNYIKKYPDTFEEILLENIEKKYNANTLTITDFITKTEYKKLHLQETPIFANMSIIDKSLKVPVIGENFKLKKAVYDLLETSHEQTKARLASLRKSGELKKEVKVEPKKKEIPVFDTDKEKFILKQIQENKNNAVARHFSLNALLDFYYKYRDLDEKYVDKCIEVCIEDINTLTNLHADYRKQEISRIRQLSDFHSKEQIEAYIANVKFLGIIPAFNRLAIIYEKNKRYNDAIIICEHAIGYYTKYDMPDLVSDFEERKEKLLKKVI